MLWLDTALGGRCVRGALWLLTAFRRRAFRFRIPFLLARGRCGRRVSGQVSSFGRVLKLEPLTFWFCGVGELLCCLLVFFLSPNIRRGRVRTLRYQSPLLLAHYGGGRLVSLFWLVLEFKPVMLWLCCVGSMLSYLSMVFHCPNIRRGCVRTLSYQSPFLLARSGCGGRISPFRRVLKLKPVMFRFCCVRLMLRCLLTVLSTPN